MNIGNRVQRTDMFGEVAIFTINDLASLQYHKDLHKEGYEYAVMVDGAWVAVGKEVVEQKPIPNVCVSCEG